MQSELSGTVPVAFDDPLNAQILAVSEDLVQGFHEEPFQEIARGSGVELDVVLERIRAMLEAGTIRRVRQTLLATSLARGALVAWQVPEDGLQAAFDYMFRDDPFSGHVVIRTTDTATPGSTYRLWTTAKVPQGCATAKHCDYVAAQVGATGYRVMPAHKRFALGVGHTRRRGIEPGSRADVLADVQGTEIVELTDLEWRALLSLKREFEPDEI